MFNWKGSTREVDMWTMLRWFDHLLSAWDTTTTCWFRESGNKIHIVKKTSQFYRFQAHQCKCVSLKGVDLISPPKTATSKEQSKFTMNTRIVHTGHQIRAHDKEDNLEITCDAFTKIEKWQICFTPIKEQIFAFMMCQKVLRGRNIVLEWIGPEGKAWRSRSLLLN